MANEINIAGKMRSATTEGILADASQIQQKTGQTVEQAINELDNKATTADSDISNLNANTGISEYKEFSDQKEYKAGTTVLKDGLLYTFTTNHAAGAWNPDEVEDGSIKKEVEKQNNSLDKKLIVLASDSLFNTKIVNINTINGYIDSQGEYIENINAKVSDFIDTNIEKVFLYTGLMSGNNPNIVGYDAEKKYIGSVLIGNGEKRENYFVVLTDSIKYIRIQSSIILPLSLKYVCDNQTILNDLYRLNNLLGNKAVVKGDFLSIGTTTNGYINSDGVYVENSNAVLSDYIDVTNLSMLIYTGQMNGSNPNVVWYDGDKNYGGILLKEINNADGTYFSIPNYAKYIRVQSVSSLSLQYTKNLSDLINGIENILYTKDYNALENIVFTKQFIDSKGIISENDYCNLSDFISVEYADRYFLTSQISNVNPMAWGFDESKQVTNILVYGDKGQKRTDYLFTIPKDVKFIRVQSINENPILFKGKNINDDVKEIKDDVKEIKELVYYISNDILNEVSFTNQWINSEGEISSKDNVYLSDYIDVTSNEYYATGQMSGSNPIVVSYNSEKTFIGVALRTNDGEKLIDEKFQINNADIKYIRIQSINEKPQLKKKINIKDKIEELSNNNFVDYVAPQIYQSPQKKKNISDGVRIMGFGSSFFMNTWWYLPYLLQEAGINAELSFFYTGGASFDQWIDRYENNTSIDCWTSTNGSDFVKTSKKFRDCIEEKWDIIGFQQGVYQSRDWTSFQNWSKLLSYIRRSCSYDTFIGFNCLWPPAIQGDLSPYPSTAEGQKFWQLEANENFKKFLALSGLNCGAVPNGATIWALRKNALTKDEVEDLAYGGLHINNGLPMYATAATWFETIVSPMFGITIDNIDWMPTEETPKCLVSPNYTPISEEQRDLIRKIIKLSASDRFGLNELK